ncbi:hypothetical protein ACN47E_009903 [Coniothyrium glycines]
MRSFHQLVAILFAFLACAFAQSSDQYEATVYITSTVTRVNTVTISGSHSGTLANQTSTIHAVYPTAASASYSAGNGTASVAPTGSQVNPNTPQFTGAASTLNVGSYVVALAAGVAYFVL